MIQVNELRVGNFFTDKTRRNYPVEIETVSRYGTTKIRVTEEDSGYVYDSDLTHLDPIPLTPETISKCTSFKLINDNSWWDCYQCENGWYISYAKHVESSAGVQIGKFYYGDGFQQVDYVHDLQNLHLHSNFKK